MLKLATIGLSSAQAEAVADMLTSVEAATKAEAETLIEAGREKARVRWHKWDEKRRSNVSKRLPTAANASQQLAGVKDRTSNLDIEPQDKKQTAQSRDVDEFRAGLSPDVPFDLITEFIKVRRKKRGAITKFAAELFREDAAKCGLSVADAAKECVRSSWITVKPEYFTNRQRAGPAPPKRNPALEAANRLMEQLDAVTPSESQTDQPYPRLVAFTGGG